MEGETGLQSLQLRTASEKLQARAGCLLGKYGIDTVSLRGMSCVRYGYSMSAVF